ncbi:hypothetical protein Mapa_009051 [Marchantia paleacea]|nr:hypothetical protein Mapa_009051 [Marchantia paleacea]
MTAFVLDFHVVFLEVKNASTVTIDDYETVPSNSEKDLQKAVAHQPVCVGIDASQDDFYLYTSGIYDADCGTDLDHAVVVVSYGSEEGEDYWIVRNSWSETWGEEGYARMKRNVNTSEGICCIAMLASCPVKKISISTACGE